MTEAGQCCLDIYNDFDRDEIKHFQQSVQLAWHKGRKLHLETTRITCWSCKQELTIYALLENDGDCTYCDKEIKYES